jgi:hypothetical protein
VSARIKAGSRFKPFLCFVLIDLRCLFVPQAEDHSYKGKEGCGPRLVSNFPPRGSGFCPSTSVSTVNSHYTDCTKSSHSHTTSRRKTWHVLYRAHMRVRLYVNCRNCLASVLVTNGRWRNVWCGWERRIQGTIFANFRLYTTLTILGYCKKIAYYRTHERGSEWPRGLRQWFSIFMRPRPSKFFFL